MNRLQGAYVVGIAFGLLFAGVGLWVASEGEYLRIQTRDSQACEYNAVFAAGLGLALYNDTQAMRDNVTFSTGPTVRDWTGVECAEQVRDWAASIGYRVWLPPCAFGDQTWELMDCISYAERQAVGPTKSEADHA